MVHLRNIVVVIASKGRPDDLADWLGHIARQTVQPVEMIWAVSSDADLPAVDVSHEPRLRIVKSRAGLTTQRNAALEVMPDNTDFVAFFDDDYVPSSYCLEGIIRALEAHPQAVGVTGMLLADGINDIGIDRDRAHALIADHDGKPQLAGEPCFEARYGLYGCNMAYRYALVGQVRFDENLPLYGWQEDVDFSRRIDGGDRIGWTNGFAGVHRGVKGGRTSGKRLGYSQIANPIYLYRKRSLPLKVALTLMTRNLIANHVKSLRPEAWVDRRGRANGNWLAIVDLVRGKLHPMRAIEIKS